MEWHHHHCTENGYIACVKVSSNPTTDGMDVKNAKTELSAIHGCAPWLHFCSSLAHHHPPALSVPSTN